MLRVGVTIKKIGSALVDLIITLTGQASMKLPKLFIDIRRDDSRASHLAIGALLVMTILYSATMI